MRLRTLGAALRRHPLLGGGFLLALGLTLFFAARMALFTLYWSDPAHREQPLEPWMTPRYIAHSWHLPPDELRALLGPLPPEAGRRPTLRDIAAARGIPVETLIDELGAALAARSGSPADANDQGAGQ